MAIQKMRSSCFKQIQGIKVRNHNIWIKKTKNKNKSMQSKKCIMKEIQLWWMGKIRQNL